MVHRIYTTYRRKTIKAEDLKMIEDKNKDKKMSDNEIIQKIFDLKNLSLGRNGWVWWFWLFFFKNPSNPQKPKQMAILWSIRNDANIKCNGIKIGTKNPIKENESLEGGVAAWYFDGLKMHDNFLLSKVKINKKQLGITTISPDTTFQFKKDVFQIIVKDKMKFEATLSNDINNFINPWKKEHKYFGLGYDMIGVNKLNLKASVDGEISEGSAYFQKVILNTATPSWYWGIFHFENSVSLSYFNPYLLGKSLKKDVSFYDGRFLHKFNNIKVRKTGNSLPIFNISAKNNEETLEFIVKTYSKTSWDFSKKKFGFIPINFRYRQYPAKITSFRFKDLDSNLMISEKNIGFGIGNAEHSTGILL